MSLFPSIQFSIPANAQAKPDPLSSPPDLRGPLKDKRVILEQFERQHELKRKRTNVEREFDGLKLTFAAV